MKYAIVITVLSAALAAAGCAGSGSGPAPQVESADCQQAIATVKAVLALSPVGLAGTSMQAYRTDLAAAVKQCPAGDPGVRAVTLTPAQLAGS